MRSAALSAEWHFGVVLAHALVARRVGDREAGEVELVRALQPWVRVVTHGKASP